MTLEQQPQLRKSHIFPREETGCRAHPGYNALPQQQAAAVTGSTAAGQLRA